jgi:hypothetical protein
MHVSRVAIKEWHCHSLFFDCSCTGLLLSHVLHFCVLVFCHDVTIISCMGMEVGVSIFIT